MRTPERSPERDAAIEAMLPHVPYDGWTLRALRRGLEASGGAAVDAELLFPGGPDDMIATFTDWADRRMEAGAAALDMADLRAPARVRTVIALRFAQNRPYKEATRRAAGRLALPGHARAAAGTAARTVDAIWHAAGDRSADFAWYTKRFSLAPIYGATLLVWLRDSSEDDAATLAFLDRRLAGMGRLFRLRRRVEERAEGRACRLKFPSLRRA
jgi:ubiquinone biosynthesis protein COQ9